MCCFSSRLLLLMGRLIKTSLFSSIVLIVLFGTGVIGTRTMAAAPLPVDFFCLLYGDGCRGTIILSGIITIIITVIGSVRITRVAGL